MLDLNIASVKPNPAVDIAVPQNLASAPAQTTVEVKSWLTVSITSPAGRTTALPLSSAIISCLWKPRSTKSAPLS